MTLTLIWNLNLTFDFINFFSCSFIYLFHFCSIKEERVDDRIWTGLFFSSFAPLSQVGRWHSGPRLSLPGLSHALTGNQTLVLLEFTCSTIHEKRNSAFAASLLSIAALAGSNSSPTVSKWTRPVNDWSKWFDCEAPVCLSALIPLRQHQLTDEGVATCSVPDRWRGGDMEQALVSPFVLLQRRNSKYSLRPLHDEVNTQAWGKVPCILLDYNTECVDNLPVMSAMCRPMRETSSWDFLMPSHVWRNRNRRDDVTKRVPSVNMSRKLNIKKLDVKCRLNCVCAKSHNRWDQVPSAGCNCLFCDSRPDT